MTAACPGGGGKVEQFQGGLAAQPESAALVKKLGFADVIPGF